MIRFRRRKGQVMKSTPTTLIKDGTLVNAESVERADILIRGDVIAEIGDLAGRLADRVDDASGMLVFPGAVDPHVHFNDEFMGTISVHDFASGTRAAAFGGVTISGISAMVASSGRVMTGWTP